MQLQLSMCLTQRLSLQLRGFQEFRLEALKAFHKISVSHGAFYTCNVKRLRACDRLGEERVIHLWRTHFFLASPCFDMVEGVIFNTRPGLELANFVSSLCFLELYLALDRTTIVNTRTGRILQLDHSIEFASDE